MANIINPNYLNLPEQVLKNKEDILKLFGSTLSEIQDLDFINVSNVVYSDGKATFTGVFRLTRDETSVDIPATIVIPIKAENGIVLDANKSNDGIEIHIDNEVVITKDGQQEIVGTKIFYEMIGIKNQDNTIDFIKHINNNFIISTSQGINLLDIDHNLKTAKILGRNIAFDDEISKQIVDYTVSQTTNEITFDNLNLNDDGGVYEIYITGSINGLLRLKLNNSDSGHSASGFRFYISGVARIVAYGSGYFELGENCYVNQITLSSSGNNVVAINSIGSMTSSGDYGNFINQGNYDVSNNITSLKFFNATITQGTRIRIYKKYKKSED